MENNTYTFNDSEISALLLGLNYAGEATKECIDCYIKSDFPDLAKEAQDRLETIKSLYKRFLPYVPDCELPGFFKGGED